jgi:hypothetical protein
MHSGSGPGTGFRSGYNMKWNTKVKKRNVIKKVKRIKK